MNRTRILTRAGDLKTRFLAGFGVSVTISGMVPITFNARDRSHWRTRHEAREDWEEALHLYLGGYGPWRRPYPCSKNITKVRGRTVSDPRKVAFSLLVTRKRLQDPGNWGSNSKEVLDALVRLGWLVDDDSNWLTLIESSEKRFPEISTTISLQIDNLIHSV